MNLPDVVSWLNRPIPGDPDPQITRYAIVALIMVVAFATTKQARSSWHRWVRRVKREKQQFMALLVVNGLALIAAAMRDDPIRVVTGLFALTFASIAMSLLARFRNDGSTAPVYPQLYPRNIVAQARRRHWADRGVR